MFGSPLSGDLQGFLLWSHCFSLTCPGFSPGVREGGPSWPCLHGGECDVLTGHQVLSVPVNQPASPAPRHCTQPVNRGHQAHWSPIVPANTEDYSGQTLTCSPEPSPAGNWVIAPNSAALSVAKRPFSSMMTV